LVWEDSETMNVLTHKTHSILAVIPARGGSKSIPRKNIKEFLGKPLLAWTVETAKESGVFDRIILSTDLDEIAEIGKSLGVEVPFLRPPELAIDTTLTAPVVKHTVAWLEEHDGWVPKFVMVLEPTSPARRRSHIREAADLLLESGCDSMASVSLVPHHYNPEKMLKIHRNGTIAGFNGTPIHKMIHRRQDLPTYYAFNGLIFACRAEVLSIHPPTLWGEKVLAYVVDQKYNLDIDHPGDWGIAEARMKRILEEEKKLT
jgi:CMP-N,N'-diacetyllegionaminic acid synthase